MNKFLIFFLIFFSSCSDFDKKKLIITDENNKFDISTNQTLKKSLINHFNNFGMDHNPDDIIVLDINKSKTEIYRNVLKNNTHVDYLTRNPEDIFNLISLIGPKDRELLLECINTFIRHHAVKLL